MPKLIVSIDGVVIKEVQLSKDRTTIGRRPYNDVVIDNLAVSGEHAVLQVVGQEVHLEDLNSTNGTYINGKAIKKQLLQNNDTVEIGKYKIKYVSDAGNSDLEKSPAFRHSTHATGGGDHQGAFRSGGWPRGVVDQSRHHHRQTRRRRRRDHTTPGRLRRGPCGRRGATHAQWRGIRHRRGRAEERGCA
jgi:hypothetical protein